MGAEQRKDLIEEIQEKRGNSRLICCLTSDRDNVQGQIAKDFLFRFFQHLRKMATPENPQVEKLDVLLFTLGGDTLAAYALARLVRQFAKTVGVLIPYMCHSSGTLFALGADDIVMTRLATLSSIDPSILGPLNPPANIVVPGGMAVGMPVQTMPVPVGVESVAGFRRLIQDVWRLDEEGTATAFRLLSEKVHPLLLGDLQRSKEQIVQLATTLLKLRSHAEQDHDRRKSDPDRIAKTVEMLASNFGSHDYLVSKTEARDNVHLTIAEDDNALEELILKLYEDFAEEMELGTPFDPLEGVTFKPGQAIAAVTKTVKVVMIESLERSDVWEREFSVIPPNQIQLKRNHWRK